MKKSLVLGAAVCVALAFTSCKSQESAYKKAYEKAKLQESQQVQQTVQEEAPVVTELVTQPVTQTVVSNTPVTTGSNDNITLIDGSGLKAYSVVVGSFESKGNAQGMQSRLRQGGYDAQIAYDSKVGRYRVIASTYGDRASAVQSRDAIRGSQYNPGRDAWLLIK